MIHRKTQGRRWRVLLADAAGPARELEQALDDAVGAELVVARSGDEAELVGLAPEANAILTFRRSITPAVLAAARRCRVVTSCGPSLHRIAVERATGLGILVTNIPCAYLDEVSDHAMALVLACAGGMMDRRIGRRDVSSPARAHPIVRLRGKTLGLVGYGNVAQRLVPKALGFGLDIIAFSPRRTAGKMMPFGTLTNNLEFVLSESDFVSVHLPLTPETRGLLDANALRLIRPTGYLVNTSSAGIVDERALAQALEQGRIAGAAMGEWALAQPAPENPLADLETVLVTPGEVLYSEEAVAEVALQAARQTAEVLCDQLPGNIVNVHVVEQPNFRLGLVRERQRTQPHEFAL